MTRGATVSSVLCIIRVTDCFLIEFKAPQQEKIYACYCKSALEPVLGSCVYHDYSANVHSITLPSTSYHSTCGLVRLSDRRVLVQ